MRGVILAGGLGSRLGDLTKVTNKHLLPVYSKPMIYYPIDTLVKAGVKDLIVIVSGPHSGAFLPILKNGKQFGLDHIEFAFQEKADGGIADALALAEDFADGENIAVILGDNTMDADKTVFNAISWFDGGAHIFLKQVPNPQEFGVAKLVNNRITRIVEKPKTFISNEAIIGLYLFDNMVFEYAKKCVPSERGQLEITDVLNSYLAEDNLSHDHINFFWQDAGTYENLFLANKYWNDKALNVRDGKKSNY